MPIILRLDIDKPYGRSNVLAKVKSKVKEEFWLPALRPFGYLSDLEKVLTDLNEKKVRIVSYHRLCTRPNAKIEKLLNDGGHEFGLHAEDTRSVKTFKGELETLRRAHPKLKIKSFSKHGSGQLKLGRRHYAPFEPEKYLQWAKEFKLPFPSGNAVASSAADFEGTRSYYPSVFWLEPDYRHDGFSSVKDLVEIAKTKLVIVSTHPENITAIPQVAADFNFLVGAAKDRLLEVVTPSEIWGN